jgi:hypothetical protein
VLPFYVSLCSEFRGVMSIMISAKKRCSVRLYLQLFVGGLMSNLRYLCLFVHRGVEDILCLFVFVLCTLCCQFLWIVHLWLPLQYSLMFINKPSSWKSLWQLSKEFLKKMKIKILKNKCTDNILVPKKQQIWNTVLKIM